MGLKHISADEESVTAVTVFRGLGRVVMPEDGFDRARVDAVRGNDEVARHDCSVRKCDGRSVWILSESAGQEHGEPLASSHIF